LFIKRGKVILKKKRTVILNISVCLMIIYFILHATPSIALRTHLFMTGNAIVAITTGIEDDELHNKVDKESLECQNAKCYTLTKPAFEKATQSKLRNYKVTKIGFLFFAKYYGEA
jgi:hypothetical protein